MKLITFLLLCLAFAGCNSAGGTRPEPAPDPELEPMTVSYPDIEWALDAEETRANMGGDVLDLSGERGGGGICCLDR